MVMMLVHYNTASRVRCSPRQRTWYFHRLVDKATPGIQQKLATRRVLKHHMPRPEGYLAGVLRQPSLHAQLSVLTVDPYWGVTFSMPTTWEP